MFEYLMATIDEGFDAAGARVLADLCRSAYEACQVYGSTVDTAVYCRAVSDLEEYCAVFGVDPGAYWNVRAEERRLQAQEASHMTVSEVLQDNTPATVDSIHDLADIAYETMHGITGALNLHVGTSNTDEIVGLLSVVRACDEHGLRLVVHVHDDEGGGTISQEVLH